MKTRAWHWFLCPSPCWEDTYGTRQTEGLFGDRSRHRIVEGYTNVGFGDPLLLLFSERP